ncbi:MAG: alpha/beta hydrolase [Actinomycetota bacterium]
MTLPHKDLGEGPTVVLAHDSGASATTWDRFAEAIGPQMRVIVPELPAGMTVADRASAVRALLDDLGIGECAFVGHGDGGVVAQLLAIDGGVRAMVLIDTSIADGAAERLAALEDVFTFLIWGEDDEVVPSSVGEDLCELIAGSTLALVPEAGHDVIATDGDTVFPLIYEWLRFRYLGRPHGHQEGAVPVQVLTRPPERGW